MACQITFNDQCVLANNMQFARLIDFAIQIAEQTANECEHPFVQHMKMMRHEVFWPGRGMDILEDFPDTDERKFWSRVFYDVSRAIFDRRVGLHEHNCWQAQSIHQAHATAILFEHSVRLSLGESWSAETLDRREYHEVLNSPTKERQSPPSPRESSGTV